MTFEDLSTFIVLAKTKSFRRTAENLFVSQSTVSFRLKRIEELIGCQLVDRTAKDFLLTPAGAGFLNFAIEMDKLYKSGIQTTRLLSNFRYSISIGAPDSFWKNILFPALEGLFLQHSDISFKLISDHSWVLNQLIRSNELDIGISFIPEKHPNVVYLPLLKSPFVLVAHKDLQLEKPLLTSSTIESFPFIFANWGGMFNEWFQEKYYHGAHYIEVKETSLLLHLLQNKAGIGFVPLRIARDYLMSGEFVRLNFEHSDSIPFEENYIMYNVRHEARVQPIVSLIKKYVDDNSLDATYYREFGKRLPDYL